MKANFYLNGRKKLKNIQLVVLERGRRKYFGLSIMLEKKFWDTKKQTSKSNYQNYSYLNSALNNYKEKIDEIYLKLKEKKLVVDTNVFFQTIEKELFVKELGFFEIWDEYLQAKSNEGKATTIQKSKQIKNNLLEFEVRYKNKITFSSINMKFFDDFSAFLSKVKGNSNNTIKKKFDFLKSFLNWARIRGDHNNETFKHFTIKCDETEADPLSQEELHAIIELDLSNNSRLSKVRDMLVFSCFTGQRYSDLIKLSKKEIHKVDSRNLFTKHDIQYEWKLIQKKQSHAVSVPLINKAMEILERNNYNFTLSNSNYNKYLKELGKLAKIDKMVQKTIVKGGVKSLVFKEKFHYLTSKVGRQTFITLNLASGIPHHVIMKVTGHKSVREFSKYENLNNNDVYRAIDSGFLKDFNDKESTNQAKKKNGYLAVG